MAALALWVRRTWVRRWHGLLGLGLLIALVGGVTLAVTAGARRTSSAFTRLEKATNAPSVQVELAETDDPIESVYADMPSPASLAEMIGDLPGVKGVAVASFMGATPDPKGSWFAIVSGASRGKAPQDRLVAGRLPSPDAPAEIVVNETGVKEWNTGIGRKLQIHTLARDQLLTFAGVDHEEPRGPVIDATVVGIIRGLEDVSDVPEPAFGAGEAFLRKWGDDVAQITAAAQVHTDPQRTAEVVKALNDRLDPHYVASRTVDRDDLASRVSDTIDVDVTVLTIFAVAAALAGLLVIAQALTRTVRGHEADEESLAALGVTRSESTIALVGAVTPAVIIGVVGAVVLATALSPVFPTGLARRADPALGVDLDVPVLLGGGVTLLVVVIALATIASWRAVRDRSREARRPATSRLGIAARLALLLPPVASLGTTFALERGPRRRAVVGLPGIVGAAVLVGGAVGVATVERSRHTLLSTSALYGASWDYELDLEGVDPDTVLPALAHDPDVVALGTRSQLVANGGDLDVRGPKGSSIVGPMSHTMLKGSIPPVIDGGRAPGPGEAAIGRRLGHRLGVGIGDSIVVEGYRGDVPLVVSGWFVNAGQDDLDLGVYVAPETLDAFTKQGCATDDANLACTIAPEGAGLAVRPGARRADVLQRLTAIAPDLVAVGPPSVVDNLDEVGNTPWLLAGFLALIGGSGLAHALIVGVRRRRRDLAVVRVIGLRPRQARRVISWQAFVMATAGAVIGLLVGLLVGRLVWERIATGVGAVVRVDVPLAALVLAPALAIGLGLGLALLTGRRASGLRPATVLRAE